MADKQRLSDLLSGLSLDDITLDAEGRVSIDNPEIAAQLAQARRGGEITPADFNLGCTSNSGCGKKAQ